MNSFTAAETVGCTYRQIDYWCRLGLLGEHVLDVRTGPRWSQSRVFTAQDVERLWAIKHLYGLGSNQDEIRRLLPVLERPVNPSGEFLVVPLDGPTQRHGHLCLDELTGFDAARVIRLKSFAADTTAQPVSA